MTNNTDIRWEQRFANYTRALANLSAAVELSRMRALSDLEKQGLIQAFEFTHELAWNVMKDYFAHQGNPAITGSRDAVRETFNNGLVADGAGWMDMIRSRNQSPHAYNQAVADEIALAVVDSYAPLFHAFHARMAALTTGSGR